MHSLWHKLLKVSSSLLTDLMSMETQVEQFVLQTVICKKSRVGI